MLKQSIARKAMASVSMHSSAVEEQPAAELATSSQHWTSIDSKTESEDADFVCVLPGRKVPKFNRKRIKILEQIGKGGQGTIHTAQIYSHTSGVNKFKPARLQINASDEHEPLDVQTADEFKPEDKIYVAKVFKGRNYGQWPEEVFGLHLVSQYVCRFEGYCVDGDSFYLLIERYDCSLRDAIDKQMKKENFNGRPFPDLAVLNMIIYIALGMRFLHENNIIHRDLKADYIFVCLNPEYVSIPSATYIGDYVVASNVVGTLFWRAPEVLQALKDGNSRPDFTPKADVYSYAMTCYEILTGGILFEGVGASNYDVVLSGKRPKLPTNLNPKMTDLINRCWHQDPNAKPTFNEIVVELQGLHKELVTGSQFRSECMYRMIDGAKSCLDVARADPESSLVELKELFQVLLGKYNQADFLVLGREIVADMEQFQSRFGFRSFKLQPVLPFSEWFARSLVFFDSLIYKMGVFGRINPNIVESTKITTLMWNIMNAMCEIAFSADFEYEKSPSEAEMAARRCETNAYLEERQRRILPDYRHGPCQEQVLRMVPGMCTIAALNSTLLGTGDMYQMCDLCGSNPLYFDYSNEEVKSCLYIDSDSTSTKSPTSIFSSLQRLFVDYFNKRCSSYVS